MGKHFQHIALAISICFFVCSFCIVHVNANEVETNDLESETMATSDLPITEDNTEDQTIPTETQEPGVLIPIDSPPIRTVAPVTPSNSNGFKAVLLGLLGNYDPIVYDYTYQSYSGSYSHSITIQEDYPWLCGAAIFSIVLYCVFRMIGGIFIGKR